MGLTKRWLEQVSTDMGLEGEITEAVIEEGQRRQEYMADMDGDDILTQEERDLGLDGPNREPFASEDGIL